MYDELVKRLRCQRFGNCPNCAMWYTEEVEPNLWRERCAAIDAADAIEDLIAALTASNEVIAKSKPKWISVEEWLPEEGKNVLVCICADGKYDITRGWYDKKQGFCCWDDAAMESAGFTKYWMSLPEPPKEEKNETVSH